MNIAEVLNSIFNRLADAKPIYHLGSPREGVSAFTVKDGHKLHHLDTRPRQRAHNVGTVESLAAYAHREAGLSPDTSKLATVFVSGERVVLVLGDGRPAEYGEVVTCPIAHHHRLKRWVKLCGTGVEHKDLRSAVEQYKEDLTDRNLLATLSRVSLRHTIELDSDDADGVLIKILDGQKAAGTATIPKSFSVRVPVFTAMPLHTYRLEMALDVRLEKGDRPRAVFDVRALNLDDVLEQALADLYAATKAAMGEEWLVVQGVAAASPAPALRFGQEK